MADTQQSKLLEGKSAVITGGVTGIGRAIALEFIRQGAFVTVCHLDDPISVRHFNTLAREVEDSRNGHNSVLSSFSGDISKPETGKELIEDATKTFGKVDIFVSNAGICQFADFLTIEPDLFSKTVRTNLDGAFYATQAAARQMAEQGNGGSIIGISSISALVGGGLQTHYTPTKAGVLSLMQSCAVALGKYNIRCNAILPGTIRTQMNEEDLSNDEKREYMEKRIPLGRTGVPEDIAGPAVFLASDMSRYVTGAQLLVDGGLFVNLQ
ncbi:NAD(P)-binding protein [Xylona heveae TC161]|uniref:NAD(P)-binding protein n=1 Tax=Xylona heveae (strain CBS 132557 / TC161) TaxID=1328760 RepID=A0A165I2R7_XYLHT|nr:NAD(P)-binding protein [Xylona heveae TC161]KZF24289.1 NAD(P)-binding protein [Xylona heveae TC161]